MKPPLQGLFNIRNHGSFPELADRKYSSRASQKYAHSLRERNLHTMSIRVLFLHHPEQGVPGNAIGTGTHR